MSNLSTVVVPGSNSASYQSTYWLALALTQGLGPQAHQKTDRPRWRGRAHFSGQPDRTRSRGGRAVSAQSLATGKSLELAQPECAKAAEAGAKIISLSDPEYPPRLKEIYDSPVTLFVKGNVEVLAQPGIAMGGDSTSYTLRQRHGRAPVRLTSPLADW